MVLEPRQHPRVVEHLLPSLLDMVQYARIPITSKLIDVIMLLLPVESPATVTDDRVSD